MPTLNHVSSDTVSDEPAGGDSSNPLQFVASRLILFPAIGPSFKGSGTRFGIPVYLLSDTPNLSCSTRDLSL
jgi:hypothetical protein